MSTKKLSSFPTIPFKPGSSIQVAGPTNTGKSYWVYRLLATPQMFERPIASVLWCYGVDQPLYNTIKHNPNVPPIEFKPGLPTKKDKDKMSDKKFHVIVIDDLMEKIVNNLEMQELILKYCHHQGITAILLSQNIFQPGRYSRTISLNMHNIVLFANKRDESQVRHLARQFFPLDWRAFIKAYQDATEKPHSYILIDCTPTHPRDIQIRTDIFPPEKTKVITIC